MPMLTTFLIGRPVAPFHSPDRTESANAPIRSSTSCTSATTSTPSTTSELLARHPQRHVEHGAVLGHVDALAGEHRVAPLGDTCLLGERDEKPERLVGDAVLGVVEEEARRLAREPLGAAGIRGEEIDEGARPEPRPRALRAPATQPSLAGRTSSPARHRSG